jgi:chromosome segregation ATPase
MIMQNMNASDTLAHLKKELEREDQELHHLKEELRLKMEDMTKRKQEIPQLQQKLEKNRHEIYVDGSESDKLKRQIDEIQKKKMHVQNELNQLHASVQKNAHEHGRLTY